MPACRPAPFLCGGRPAEPDRPLVGAPAGLCPHAPRQLHGRGCGESAGRPLVGAGALRRALAVQRALFEHGREQHTPAPRASARVHARRAGLDRQRLGRPGRCRRRARPDRPGRRCHLPRAGPARGLPRPEPAAQAGSGSGLADTVAYVQTVEQVLIDAMADLGLPGTGRLRFPGVWVDPESDHPQRSPRIGVRLSRGRTMHGFALNVTTDLSMFGHIIPCGIVGKAVTSLVAEGSPSACGTWRTRSRPGQRRHGAAVCPSARTWRGGTGRATCRRSRGGRGRRRPRRGAAPARTPGAGRRCRRPPSPPASRSGSGRRCTTGPRCWR